MTTVPEEQRQQREAYGRTQGNADLQRRFQREFSCQTMSEQQVQKCLHLLEAALPSLKLAVPGKDNQFRQSVRNFLNAPVKVRQSAEPVVLAGLLRDLDRAFDRVTGHRMTSAETDLLAKWFRLD